MLFWCSLVKYKVDYCLLPKMTILIVEFYFFFISCSSAVFRQSILLLFSVFSFFDDVLTLIHLLEKIQLIKEPF